MEDSIRPVLNNSELLGLMEGAYWTPEGRGRE